MHPIMNIFNNNIPAADRAAAIRSSEMLKIASVVTAIFVAAIFAFHPMLITFALCAPIGYLCYEAYQVADKVLMAFNDPIFRGRCQAAAGRENPAEAVAAVFTEGTPIARILVNRSIEQFIRDHGNQPAQEQPRVVELEG